MATGGVAVVGGAVLLVVVEVEALEGAAAMIQYCKKGSIREAALSFVDVCVDAANGEARDFVADAKLLADPSNADERGVIEKKLAEYIPYWRGHLRNLSDQLHDTRAIRIGGQPALRDALGSQALRVLQTPDTPLDWQGMAEQIRVVFAGANAMAKYVVDHYPKHDKSEKEAGEDE